MCCIVFLCCRKVVHDCRAISDILRHRFNTHLVNVFDTMVCSLIICALEMKLVLS